MHTGGFELYCPGKQTERHVGQRYLLWLCFSVWLSTLSRRGKSPERRFTGDLTLHCQRKESRCQRGPLTDERVQPAPSVTCRTTHLHVQVCQTPPTQTGGQSNPAPRHGLHGDAPPSHRPLKWKKIWLLPALAFQNKSCSYLHSVTVTLIQKAAVCSLNKTLSLLLLAMKFMFFLINISLLL